MERIRDDTRHVNVEVVHHGLLEARRFREFSLAFSTVEDEEPWRAWSNWTASSAGRLRSGARIAGAVSRHHLHQPHQSYYFDSYWRLIFKRCSRHANLLFARRCGWPSPGPGQILPTLHPDAPPLP